MSSNLCINCFNIKGVYQVCPYCGHVEGTGAKEAFQLNPGTVLNQRYIIGEVLGYGGFGITYKAYDTVLGIIVAIKEFFPSGLVARAENQKNINVFSGNKALKYKKLLDRFIEEAQNLAMFAREKDIVNVFNYFEANKTAYIIMEYIESLLLKKYLEVNGSLPEPQACDYICSLLAALQRIHEKGIIHRDVSPDNIFLVSSSQIKLCDFGAAKFQNGDSDKDLMIVVKKGYAPPEQYRSKGRQDCRLDIYAAGAVFYHMLTGIRPAEALERSLHDKLKPPSSLGISIQPGVEKSLMKSLSLNPKERFSSAEEFKDSLTRKKSWLWARTINRK